MPEGVAPEKKIEDPKCPGCGAKPFTLAANAVQTGPFTVGLVWCGECGHTMHLQMLAVQGPKIIPPQFQPAGRG